jgi:tryptophan synthase alpha chain
MSRIADTFAELQSKGRKALIPYVTAGFPFADITPALMHGMVEAGADVIELGVPFSDPMADGPVVQKAGEKALALGIGMAQVLDMVRSFRQRNSTTPVVLMGYANPVERYEQRHGRARSRATRLPPAWTACWSWTTRPRNASSSLPNCARKAST